MRRKFRSIKGGRPLRRHWRGAHEQPKRRDTVNWRLAGVLSLIGVSIGTVVGIEWAKEEQPAEIATVVDVPATETEASGVPFDAERDEGNRADRQTENAIVERYEAPARQFGLCHVGGGQNCVVDGDTIWMDGRKIRLLNIDTPETHPPRCAREAQLGSAATERLRVLLNSGEVTAEAQGDRDQDSYGRQLRVVKVDGRDVGAILVSEGLARWYGSGRRSWCQ